MKKTLSSHRGFTLIEMILYVSVCSILLLGVSLFATSLFEARTKNQSISDVHQQGSQIMQLMTQSIRNARSIDAPGIGATGGTLSLTVTDPSLSPTVFTTVNGRVTITEGAGPNILLTNSHVTVSSLTFRNISSASSSERIVEISFTLDYNNPSGRNEYTYTKSFIGSATLRQ